jgi:hypothetical protein
MVKYKAKAQKYISEVQAYLLQNDISLNAKIQLKLDLLENLLIDYFNADNYIKENGYITTFNKGTSIGLSPLLKLKYDAIKQIRKLLQEIVKNNDNNDDADDFIKSLISD